MPDLCDQKLTLSQKMKKHCKVLSPEVNLLGMRRPWPSRFHIVRLLGATPLLLLPPSALSSDLTSLSTAVRTAVVRGAQLADSADAVWQQIAGEVTPPWQKQLSMNPMSAPPPLVDMDFASAALALPLEAAASCTGMPLTTLVEMLPATRQEAALLYGSGSGQDAGNPGTAVRGFSKEVVTALNQGGGRKITDSTVFGFEAFVTWRVLQRALSEERYSASERRAMQRCVLNTLGKSMLRGPLQRALLPSPGPLEREGLLDPAVLAAARRTTSLRTALAGCDALLRCMQSYGLLSRFTLLDADSLDDDAWRAGDAMTWQYVVGGSQLVGASQLAQDRTAATGQGAGLYPGLLVTAPLRQYLLEAHGVEALLEEYFLDNRVGRPDPRTFSDPRYYSDVLIEVVVPRIGRG